MITTVQGRRPYRVRDALLPAGVALLVVGLATAWFAWPRATGQPSVGGLSTANFDARLGSGSRAQDISRLQDRLRSQPGDWQAWAALGALYVEQGRVTADPTFYPKADGAFERSLAIDRDRNFAALAGAGMLANARHDFAAGLDWGEKARRINPDNAGVHGVIGDALLELGRYEEGFAAIQRMVDLRPALPSYARVAHARELQGDVAGAAASLAEAFQAAGAPSDAAFASFRLGELHWSSGQLDAATAAYTRSSQIDPSFLPARAGLARVHAATGDVAGAIDEYREVVAALPAPQFVIELSDLYSAAGQPEQADTQAALLDAQERLLVANGVNIDAELALFSADHRVDLSNGLAAAQAAYDRAPSVAAADALAWQLHVNGRAAEALPLAEQALRLGTRSALFHFHRGMIRGTLGDAAARADLEEGLRINSHFSVLHAPEAQRILATPGCCS